MLWKLFAVFSVILYFVLLHAWFTGFEPATVQHYLIVVIRLPVVVATVCYAFEFSIGAPSFWRAVKLGLIGVIVLTAGEYLFGHLELLHAQPSGHQSSRSLSFALIGEFLTLLEFLFQLLALSNYVSNKTDRRPENPKYFGQAQPDMLFKSAKLERVKTGAERLTKVKAY